MPTHPRAESSNPLLLPHTHTAKRAAQPDPGREERSESNPSTKGIGRADNPRHRSPLPASKVYGFVYSWATLLAQALFRVFVGQKDTKPGGSGHRSLHAV
ncbi:hypothetical protein llap_12426 [Limosa lapponica baueri]|uniref:Uncharacterized protein n=1 Tax=Limosa lapponica baueri TaxID=1758121 RepID=A0A2I0TU06_LIMLA|nr:hypothetical protein llap_12426 [Limosa lapponica baueri]